MKAIFVWCCLVVALLPGAEAGAQDAAAQTDSFPSAVESRRYVFDARMALPQRGRMIPLTSTYDLRVTPDSIISRLPYFGRAYSAPLGGDASGIEFVSTDFDYKQKKNKKGVWKIEIRPRDVTDVRQLLLSFSQDGNASLQVISNNRQQISFTGVVR